MRKPPVFILGVPRSGTTLVRTILDSHSQVACGPETPWLAGHQPRSVMELCRFLREHPQGYCAGFAMGPGTVVEAARGFVSVLMEAYAGSKGKSRWAEKTPNNALHIPFLLELFPEAKFIWLERDGLDVAMSTSIVSEARRGISPTLEKHLSLGPGTPAVQNNPLTALLRWSHWNRLIGRGLEGRERLRVSYERLVREPGPTVRQITDFIGEPFEPGMLDYASRPHDFPPWEWGSADVRSHAAITTERVGRGRRELSAAQLAALGPVTGRLEGPIDARPLQPPPEGAVRQAAAWLQGLITPLRIDSPGVGLEAAWLWVHAGARMAWDGADVVDVGGAGCRGGLSWAAAIMGARVTIIGRPDEAMTKLRDGLRVDVRWQEPGGGSELSLPSGSVDAVIGLRLATSAAEVARILKPRGLAALSREGDGPWPAQQGLAPLAAASLPGASVVLAGKQA